jgi:hypothetical protein
LLAKLEALESGLTEQERAAFLAVVVLASAELLADSEVSGFQWEGEPDDLMSLAIAHLGDGSVTFTSVSNVLKTRHDTVKNSISNVR